jgi:hypothetical protein
VSGAAERERLARAYRATTYRVYLRQGAHIDLHPGRRSAELDRLLARLGARSWAFITAWNPGSRAMPAWRNAHRQRALLAMLHAQRRQVLAGAGIPATAGWAPEESLLVANLSSGSARKLARRFGQNALLMGRRGGPVRLEWSR